MSHLVPPPLFFILCNKAMIGMSYAKAPRTERNCISPISVSYHATCPRQKVRRLAPGCQFRRRSLCVPSFPLSLFFPRLLRLLSIFHIFHSHLYGIRTSSSFFSNRSSFSHHLYSISSINYTVSGRLPPPSIVLPPSLLAPTRLG